MDTLVTLMKSVKITFVETVDYSKTTKVDATTFLTVINSVEMLKIA